MTNRELVLIIDYGGAGAQLVTQRVREQKVYAELVPSTVSLAEIKSRSPKGIILAGSDCGMPAVKPAVSELGVPILNALDTQMSDAMSSLRSFLFDVCQLNAEWSVDSFAEEAIAAIKSQVKGGQVICALSGGVDSSVAATLVQQAVGDQLTSIFVNHGLLRQGEPEQVLATFRQRGFKVVYVDARQRFLGKLAGVTDPERKRKIIGQEFIRVFEEEAKRLGKVDYLVQGTVYPDVIESGSGSAVKVKSHHNVGGLPENMNLKLIEPLRYLFKDEVRRLGEELGLPEELVWRHPFPGPGLAVRVLGEVTADKVAILQAADAIVTEEIKAAGLYRKIWQAFAVLPDIKSVGMAQDERTYAYTIAVRAVESTDAMTAEWSRVPYEVLDKIMRRITSEVPHVNRVVYDITSKPPATIEWE